MRVVVLAAASFITFKWILIPIRTEGSSMLPTFSANRLNLVNRLAYVASTPSRGDVVAIKLAGRASSTSSASSACPANGLRSRTARC